MVRPAAPAAVMMLLTVAERLFADAKALDAIMLQLKKRPQIVEIQFESLIQSLDIA
jgi:hypothetical protein